MKLKKLLLLILITLVLIMFAARFWHQRAPETGAEKTLLLPNLAERINDVKIVEIKGYQQQVILSHQSDGWVIQSSDNFPALSDKVKKLIIAIAELTIESKKTSNPELYPRLALEGPYERSTKSKLVSLLNEDGDAIASLIIGKPRETNPALPALYVRHPDDEQSYLVQGKVEASSRANDWFEQQIIHLDAAEIKQVTITHPGETGFSVGRDNEGEANFALIDLPAGKKPQSEVILNRLGRLLEGLRADGVRSINTMDMENTSTVRIESFRGLITQIRLKQNDNKHYANFTFSYQQPEAVVESETMTAEEIASTAKQEIDLLNQKMSPWVFDIPEFKFKDMTMTLDKLIRE